MKSIRRHLVIWLLTWLSLLCVVAVVAFVFASRKSLVADFDRALSPELANARLLLRPGPLGFNNPENRGVEIFIQAWDSDTENTLYKSANLERRSLPFRKVRPRITLNENATLEDGEPVRIAATGIVTFASGENAEIGNRIVVAVAKNRSQLDRRIRNLTVISALIGGLGTLVAVGIARLAVERGIRPLDRLGNRVDEIDPGSLETRLETDGLAEELRPFALRINDLLSRVEDGFARERRFSGDLSHELRTPIAEIRATAEFASLYPDRASKDDYLSILQTTERLERIVESQLALARIESAAAAEEQETVALNDLIGQLLESRKTEQENRQLRIEFPDNENRFVETNPELLRTILDNLLGNAMEYAPEKSTIQLSVPDPGSEEWFRIANPAPDLEKSDLPRLFERLWRKEAARSDTRHSGLGLSLARSSAEALNLSLRAGLEGGILTFSLSENS